MVNAPRKREGQQLLLRFPEGSDLRDRLDEIARSNNRSLTAEVIHRLEMSLTGDDAAVPDFERGRVHDLEKDLEALRAEVRALATEVRKNRK